MPRRNYPRKRKPRDDDDGERLGAPDLILTAPPRWNVRLIQPVKAVKTYRCPGCNQEIRPGVGHVVAWRDGGEDDRRHWHTPCWKREVR
ncbi:MAG TPA: ATP/GTP-binding protein [Actinomycetota bacterium]|nr:ATP/GTP-binding protein [Actinomycetota bacterium]